MRSTWLQVECSVLHALPQPFHSHNPLTQGEGFFCDPPLLGMYLTLHSALALSCPVPYFPFPPSALMRTRLTHIRIIFHDPPPWGHVLGPPFGVGCQVALSLCIHPLSRHQPAQKRLRKRGGDGRERDDKVRERL